MCAGAISKLSSVVLVTVRCARSLAKNQITLAASLFFFGVKNVVVHTERPALPAKKRGSFLMEKKIIFKKYLHSQINFTILLSSWQRLVQEVYDQIGLSILFYYSNLCPVGKYGSKPFFPWFTTV